MDESKEMSIEERVKEILANYTQQPITPSAYLEDDLMLSSFDSVEMLFDFEDEFGLEIPEDDVREATTVGDLIEYLRERAGK